MRLQDKRADTILVCIISLSTEGLLNESQMEHKSEFDAEMGEDDLESVKSGMS